MLWAWITLCLMWQGTSSFMIYNSVETLCLEDSLRDVGVQLKRCSVDSELQQWIWTERWFLENVHTHRCLSAFHEGPVQTLDCGGGNHLQWQCVSHRLISLNRSLELGAHRGRLALTNTGINTRWRSLDEGDICQEKLRSRRQSETDEFQETEDTMTEEQREYLRWYYRTEDSAPWKFAMLALSLVALLLGCVFCVMGTMGNKHRREIAKYKAPATVKVEMEELQVITEVKEDKNSYTAQTQDGHLDEKALRDGASEADEMKPGEIMVTWKDGTVSNLYPDSRGEAEKDREQVTWD